jgi:hypothetical protein
LLCYLDSSSYHALLYHKLFNVSGRTDELGKDIGSLCLWACLSALLVHPNGGRSGDARVVTSCTGVVPGYAGSLGYDHAPLGVVGVDDRW